MSLSSSKPHFSQSQHAGIMTQGEEEVHSSMKVKLMTWFAYLGMLFLPVFIAYQAFNIDPTLDEIKKQHESIDVTGPKEVVGTLKIAASIMVVIVFYLVYNYHKMSTPLNKKTQKVKGF